jgi:hypothetical protein
MNATTRQSILQRSSALALAAVVTLALLGGIDALAAREVNANALLAQQVATPAGHS